MKRLVYIIIIVVVLIGGGAFYWYSTRTSVDANPDAKPTGFYLIQGDNTWELDVLSIDFDEELNFTLPANYPVIRADASFYIEIWNIGELKDGICEKLEVVRNSEGVIIDGNVPGYTSAVTSTGKRMPVNGITEVKLYEGIYLRVTAQELGGFACAAYADDDKGKIELLLDEYFPNGLTDGYYVIKHDYFLIPIIVK